MSTESHAHPDDSPKAKDAFDTYIEFWKMKYREAVFPSYLNKSDFRWKAHKVIKLVLVNRDVKKEVNNEGEFTHSYYEGSVDWLPYEKTSLSLNDIGILTTNGKNIYTRKILIEGAPGVGKTTLMWKLCQAWANETLLNRFSLVLLLQMHHERIRHAQTLKDLLFHSDDHLREVVEQNISDSSGKGLLLIFDGFDEISST